MSDSPNLQAVSCTLDVEWPNHVDALVAAPDRHMLRCQIDRVRALDKRMRPGEPTPIHTHRWPTTIYTITFLAPWIRSNHGQ